MNCTTFKGPEEVFEVVPKRCVCVEGVGLKRHTGWPVLPYFPILPYLGVGALFLPYFEPFWGKMPYHFFGVSNALFWPTNSILGSDGSCFAKIVILQTIFF